MNRGLVGILLLAAIGSVLTPSAARAATHDDVNSPKVITSIPYTDLSDNSAATVQQNEVTSCGLVATVWYKFTPTSNQELRLGLISSFQPSGTIWRVNGDGSWSMEACFEAFKLHAFSAGSTYYFQIGGRTTLERGAFTFELGPKSEGSAPPHDNNTSPRKIPQLPYLDVASTENATLQAGELMACSVESTVWYKFDAGWDTKISATTAGSSFEASIGIWSVSPSGGWSVAGCGKQTIELNLRGGHSYYFQIGGGSWRDRRHGSLKLDIRRTDDAPNPLSIGPENDSAFAPHRVNVLPHVGVKDTRTATLQAGELTPCFPMTRTVWYSFLPTRHQPITVDTSGSSYLTGIVVWRKPIGSPDIAQPQVTCDKGSGPIWGKATLTMEPGYDYLFQIGSTGPTGGVLNVRFQATGLVDNGPTVPSEVQPWQPMTNDDLSNPRQISSLPYLFYQTTVRASLQPSEVRPCGNIGSTVWFEYKSDRKRDLVATAALSDFPAVVAVWRVDASTGQYHLHGCADMTDPLRAGHLPFQVEPGTTYMIQAGGVSGAQGRLVLGITDLDKP